MSARATESGKNPPELKLKKTISSAGNRRYTTPGDPIRVAEPAFALTDTTSLAVQTVPPPDKTTYSDIDALLTQVLAGTPGKRGSLQVIATHELPAAA